MRSWLSGLACLVTLASVSNANGAAPTHGAAALLVQPHQRLGQSVGSPTDGHLLGGVRLDDAPYLRILPVYAGNDARWGLGTLVSLIDRSAKAVRKQFPDAVLSVGHLSRRGGGDIDRHASHESGRDADLSFYIRSQTNHPLYSDHMVSFRGDGTAPSWPGAYFDDARNWTLVSNIVQEAHARVTYIFVAAPLRARLLAYAAHIGAAPAIRNRAAELMVQPRGSLPHDDHFHVRIGCPSGMTACIELPVRAKPAHDFAVAHREHAPTPSAKVVASAKHVPSTPAPHHAPPPSSPSPAPSDVPEPASPDEQGPDGDDVPTHSAVLVSPFDDVDGPVVPSVGPEHLDIQ
jgi:penicillin-insensitive murein endopeptidase